MSKKRQCELCDKPAVVLHQKSAYCPECYLNEEGYLSARKLPSGRMAVSVTLKERPKTQVVRRRLYD